MPGGALVGYAGDTGLDIGGRSMPVFALAAGTIEYAEAGHTRWTSPEDTALCVRLRLDTPLPWKGHRVTHVYYAHLRELAFEQPEVSPNQRHVEGGEYLGVSGLARGVHHLHLGLLLDGHVEQDDWTYILREHEIRQALGGYAQGERLLQSQ